MDTVSKGSLEQARSELQKLYGVGQKVADCTLYSAEPDMIFSHR